MLKRRLKTFSTSVLVGIIVIALRILGWSRLAVITLILATFISWMIEKIPSNIKQQIEQNMYKMIFSIRSQVAESSNIPKQWLRIFSMSVLVGIIAIALRILGWSRPVILTTLLVWIIGKMFSNAKQHIVQPPHKETLPQSQQEDSTSSNGGSALLSRIQIYSRWVRTMSPSSQIGPEVAIFPITGYSIVIEMLGQTDLTILGFKAEVIRQTSLQYDAVMVKAPPPLEIPHFEILLDKNPPIVRPALNADGLPARSVPQLPFTLHHNERRSFFLAPVTHSRDLKEWVLYLIWEFEGKSLESPYKIFQVTGETGMISFKPNGTIMPELPKDHWDTQYFTSDVPHDRWDIPPDFADKPLDEWDPPRD